jgi:electron transfer flavoprotein beta subunit
MPDGTEPMNIVVLVKHVPEPTATWKFADDLTLDRGIEGRLSQLDEHAVEQAVRLVEGGLPATITYLTMGPAKATDALRNALSIGGDRAAHVVDDALHGSDAIATSLVLARAIERIGFDVVITGMASTDAEMSVVPSMIAARLGVPQVTFAHTLKVADGTVSILRDSDVATEEITASLPAVVSVTDASGDARYPSFKSIMAARKKPIETLSLADLGVEPALVGTAGAATVVRGLTPRPPRQAGTVVTDEGDGAAQLTDFLVTRKFL